MSHQPLVIVLHGLPAVGKYTIGKEVFEILSSREQQQPSSSSASTWKFFHNHLVVDMLLALFPFGSPPFKKYREEIWLQLMKEAIVSQQNLLFTFSPDRTVSDTFPSQLQSQIESVGGRLIGIELRCENVHELTDRIGNRQESPTMKLKDSTLFTQLLEEGAFHGKESFPVDFIVDTSKRESIQESAQLIVTFIEDLLQWQTKQQTTK